MRERSREPASVEDIRACRAMLRHVGHAARLRTNRLVALVAAAAGTAADACSDAELNDLIASIVNRAMKDLTPRQNEIVRRCDLGGERFADVARAVFLSERQAFRERDAAIVRILTAITSGAAPKPTLASQAREVVEAQLANARTLEHNGHVDAAIALLRDIAGAASDASARAAIEVRLVYAHVEAERFAEAERHVESARSLLGSADSHDNWRRAEIDVAAARLAEATGSVARADDLSHRCIEQLRAALRRDDDVRIVNALVSALSLRSAIAIGHGDFDGAARLADAAVEASRGRRDIDSHAAIGARSVAAMTLVFGGGDLARAERELAACYRVASEGGMTREALVVATHLAGLFRLTKRPKLAVVTLTPLLASARAVANRECAAGVFSETAAANLEAGDCEVAARYLAEVHAHALGHRLMQPHAELVMARVHLAQRNYSAALGFSRNAESGFWRIGKERLAGSALRVQAEALAGAGDTPNAIDAAVRSIETLSGRSHPIRLAAAYRVLGNLSRDPAHLSKARKLAKSAG